MEHYEEVLKILHDKFDWKLTDSLTKTGKKLVADTIKALKIAENNQNLQLHQTAVITSIFMKNLISTFLISLVNISLFGFLARITDLFVTDCEWKCTLWFFFGIMCALSINYFVRNFRS